MRLTMILLLLTMAVAFAAGAEKPVSLKPGQKVVVEGQTFFVEKVENGKLLLTPPLAPTEAIGAFITPVDATASSFQENAGRSPRKLIDGSGWGETFPGSGVYVHTNDVYADGNCMWNGKPDSWLLFDLGKEYNVNGAYVWNYNEKDGWNSRSIKDVEISASSDNQKFAPVGNFTLEEAPGKEDYRGQVLLFPKVVKARYFKWQILSNYKGGEMSGLAEVRFSNADQKAVHVEVGPWKPKYPRPQHPKLALGRPLAGAENITFPADAGIVDVTKPPYNAQGDGKTDDTAAIQKALDDNPARGAIIYLPNGVYLVSDTLRWGGKEDQQKETVLQGQSRDGTVLRLRDDCPGFENPRRPKGVIYTGHAPAQRFGNEIHNLTVDTGTGNPGAVGVQFIANNQGGIYDVTIVSGDGQGPFGLDMGYTDEQGPCLIKNVKVVGFDVGIHVATSVASETMEHVVVQHQNKLGFRNDGQPCTVRDLRSLNEVPGFRATAGFTVLIDSSFEGAGAAATQPAVINDAAMFARNLKVKGYRIALENHAPGTPGEIAGPEVGQFLSKPAVALFGEPGKALALPIKETPELPWDDPAAWVSPQKFGARADDNQDDSDALQKAIDSGATTVYLPRGSYHIGKTILIRGKVRRIIGCKAVLNVISPLKEQAAPLFRFQDGDVPVVSLEWINTDFSGGPFFFIEHAAKRTLMLRRLAINFQKAEAYHGTGPGDVYLEDVVGRWFRLKGQSLWARQFNPEGDGTHLLNDGGTAWILGLKTEGGGALVETKNTGKTEVLGSFSYSVGDTQLGPMFVIESGGEMSISFGEVCYSDKPFPIIVRETRNGQTKELKAADPAWKGSFTLFTARQ